MPTPQKEGEFVIKGCEHGIVAYVEPKSIISSPNDIRNDRCASGNPKEVRNLQHVYKKGAYQGTIGCKDCSFHQPGTEPEIKKTLLKQIKEFIDAF